MKLNHWRLSLVALASIVWMIGGCSSSDSDSTDTDDDGGSTATTGNGDTDTGGDADTGDTADAGNGAEPPESPPPFGGEEDVARAENLWRTTLANYTSWDSYPGLDGWQPGKSPHGKVLKYYINAAAAENPASPGDGSIIIKENYGEEDGPLMAVTIMEKRSGYDPDNQDWYWVKYAADGNVMTNPAGAKLAGRVAKGMPKGCIACHSNAAGDDYLFINDE